MQKQPRCAVLPDGLPIYYCRVGGQSLLIADTNRAKMEGGVLVSRPDYIVDMPALEVG